MNYWLLKSEPSVYSWEQFAHDGSTRWNGVRNYAARIHLRAMRKNDQVFFYHSNEGISIAGIAKVTKEAYPDPTAVENEWVAVDIAPVKKLKNAVTLARIKADDRLTAMALIRNSRLSVQPVTDEEWKIILSLAGEKST